MTPTPLLLSESCSLPCGFHPASSALRLSHAEEAFISPFSPVLVFSFLAFLYFNIITNLPQWKTK
jgi:hypothetical protein